MIVRRDIIDGPRIQANGQYRARVEFEFDDGRIKQKTLRAPNEAAWNALLATINDRMQEGQAENDAAEIDDFDADIAAVGQASIQQRAVAYIRRALQQRQAYDAYRLLDRFNQFRLAQGWSINQVQANLASAGLTEKEWNRARDAFQYLNAGTRPADMLAYKDIQETWES